MDFRVLGPIEVAAGTELIDVGGKQRLTLLMLLLVRAGQVVPTDQLVRELWGENPPERARRTVQAHVAHLRKVLNRDVVVLEPGRDGYVLQVSPDSTDAGRFEQLVAEARSRKSDDPSGASQIFEQALALVRGPPFMGVSDDALSLQIEATRLEHARLSTLEEWLDTKLESGDLERVVSEAERLVAESPLRERLWELLMLALYRLGRQGEALSAFGRLRKVLIEELGIDPSPQLRDLEQRILEQDPTLQIETSQVPVSGRSAPSDLPTGIVTFLFTDIEGSSRIWEERPEEAAGILERHESLLRHLVAEGGGRVFKGVGDGVMAVFESARNALSVAIEIQLATPGNDPPQDVRVALHAGEAELHHGDYYGAALSVCHRVLGVAHGGQVVLTTATERATGGSLPEGLTLLDLGKHRLRGVTEPVHLLQMVHPSLRAEFPPLRSEIHPGHNLPVELTRFVGREREVARVRELLRSSRQVTLVGVGGGGKTRLALRVAAGLVDEYPLGTRLVELAPAAEPPLVSRLIAQAFGVPEEPGEHLLDLVASRLADGPALLVLDNCEHLLEVCAQAAAHLLRAAPALRILATSRERLATPGESVYHVPPMAAPPAESAGTKRSALRYDAVKLFVDRASLVDAGFQITDDNSEDIGRICRAVEGIPLALELAAGRVGSLRLSAMVERLARPLELLRGGSRAGDHRHHTMLTALDWSFDLLSDPEKEALGQLSVFRGGFDLDDAEVVCRVEAGSRLMELVIALHDKSLLARDPTSGRFRLLEPVRTYAGDRLEEGGDGGEVARRHAVHFAGLVEEARTHLQAPDNGVWLDRLESEHDNIRSALRWAISADDGSIAVRLAGHAWEFWKLRGHMTEGRQWLEQVLEVFETAESNILAQVLQGAGDLAAGQGDDVRARDYLERSMEMADRAGDEAGAAGSLTRLAGIAHRRGEVAEATRLLHSALERARRAADNSLIGHILAALALLAEDRGLHDEADAHLAGARAIRSDDPYLATDLLLARGEIDLKRGNGDEARAVLEEALAIARSSGFANVIAWATAYLGELAVIEGDPESGERQLSQSLAMFQGLDIPVGTVWAMRHLGRVIMERGQIERSRALLEEALRIALDEVRPDAPLMVQALADLETNAGSFERAAVLLGAAEAARSRVGVSLPGRDRTALERSTRILRQQLGDFRLGELTSRGSELSLEEAALAQDPSSTL